MNILKEHLYDWVICSRLQNIQNLPPWLNEEMALEIIVEKKVYHSVFH